MNNRTEEAKKRQASSTGGEHPQLIQEPEEAEKGEAKKRQQKHGETTPGKKKTVSADGHQVSGKAAENAQWAPEDLPMLLAAYAGLYDGSPESLLICLGEFLRLPMFEYRHLVDDQTAEVFEKLREAVLRYERAEARTLDEAFRVKRPKNFTRSAEEFKRTHGYRLVMDVWKLTQSGDITPTAALKQLAETNAYPKSFETLYNLYRDDFTEPARLIYGLMSLPFKNFENK